MSARTSVTLGSWATLDEKDWGWMNGNTVENPDTFYSDLSECR